MERNKFICAARGCDGCLVCDPSYKSREQRLAESHAALLAALEPFAEFERVRKGLGGNSSKSGALWAATTLHGHAEITVEDMDRAIAAIKQAKEVV